MAAPTCGTCRDLDGAPVALTPSGTQPATRRPVYRCANCGRYTIAEAPAPAQLALAIHQAAALFPEGF